MATSPIPNQDSEEEGTSEPPTKKHKHRENETESYSLYDLSQPAVTFSSVRASGGADNALGQVGTETDIGDLHLIDEVAEDDISDVESEDSFYDSEVPEEEIDALLEEGLPEEMKGPRSQRKKQVDESSVSRDEGVHCPYERREKVMVVEKVKYHFDILPEGWVEVIHNSGMPVYLHKDSRVCTFSRPYFLGSGSLRKHTVPLSSVPCLKYLRDLEQYEREKEKIENDGKSAEENVGINEISDQPGGTDNEQTSKEAMDPDDLYSLPPGPLASALVAQSAVLPQKIAADKNVNLAIAETRVQTINEADAQHSLDPEQLLDYCRRRFEFKTVKLLRFKSWRDKRRYEKNEKRNRPQLPDGTKLISLVRHTDDDVGGLKKEWVMNPKGKSYVCILHEYVQHVLKNQPKYEFKEVENAASPYAASVTINDVQYSTGYGSSKKQAKLEAAKAALEILLPELGKKIRMEKRSEEDEDLSFFDEIRVEDPRVTDLCNKTSELSPYTILLNCLQRNFGLSRASIECHLVTNKNQKNEFVMTVGKHTVQVNCRNKKDGKQRASQAILQKLHPHITSWGSFLRLYGNRSLQIMRERKAEEQEVTLLQTNATLHQPNQSIINKLKEEMLKLRYMKESVLPIGKFQPPEDISLPSGHGTELNNVDL